ncbi:MAG: CoA-binding protein, partial [Deltaproteobacteria bacterium]
MHKRGVGEFKYFVGVSSLAQIASRDDRVCVLNILGAESKLVTPVGHAWSGGNVVFGTSPGRRGQSLPTPVGEIPVYNSVREGLEAGHRFNCGVVYLPPAAARDGVAELIRVNPELRKIFIVTEKLSVHDSREIRALGQQRGVDIFGANSLGVADAWNRVRIGGALGGDNPDEILRKGSIAIFSNSGGFTTTIANYLLSAGWGTTTLISSGKDVYIHYAAPEFAFALANDARSKAAVLYCEPGGLYELDAEFTKPVVACVVGRWKSKLTRAVGHAGALAGGDDDAVAKERWFMSRLGVDAVFTPERPVFSARGALVTNIAHIPQALDAVMRENGARPDFAPEGSLALKPWFASNAGLRLPHELGGENDRALVNVALGAAIDLHGDPALAAAQAAREAGNSPNTVIAAALSILGPRRVERARRAAGALIEAFSQAGLKSATDASFDLTSVKADAPMRALLTADRPDARAELMLAGLRARGAQSVFVRWLESLEGRPNADAVLAAITVTLAWGPLQRKLVSRLTAENLPWFVRLLGAAIGASVDAEQHRKDRFCGMPLEEIAG